MSDLDLTFENVLGDQVITRSEPIDVYLNPHHLMATIVNKYGEEPVIGMDGKQAFKSGAVAVLAILNHPEWKDYIETSSEEDIFILLGLTLFREPVDYKVGPTQLFRRLYERMLSFKRANILKGDIAATIAINAQRVLLNPSSKISYCKIIVKDGKQTLTFIYLSNHFAVSETVDELKAVLDDAEGIEKNDTGNLYTSKKLKGFSLCILDKDAGSSADPSIESGNGTVRPVAPNMKRHNVVKTNPFANYENEVWLVTEPLKVVSRTAVDLADGTPGPVYARMKASCAFGPAEKTKNAYDRRVTDLEKNLMAAVKKESEERYLEEYRKMNEN